MQISDAIFVVTDTETTGGSPGRDRVIEIGAVKVKGGVVVDRFSQLINPGRSIPRKITQLTGISTAMTFDQPIAAQVLPAFLEFLGEGIFVAHNKTFDERFINAELKMLNRPPLPNQSLCTLRLARRILRGLGSKGLSSLAIHYGIRIENRHRALGDAEATAIVLGKLVESLEFEHGVSTVDELLAFQGESYGRRSAPSQHVARIREEVLPVLPARPGVYFMHDRRGKIIYVGKAKSLRSRVRSYFSAIEAHPPRTRKLVREVRDVSWKETGSELEALLEESRLIKSHQPKHNRALKRFGRRPFVKLDVTSAYPKVSVTNYLVDDGAEYFGPVAGSRYATFVVDLIDDVFQLRKCNDQTLRLGQRCVYGEMGKCTVPCEGGAAVVEYNEEVKRVRAFLSGEDLSVLETLERSMKEAAAKLEFEQARQYRDWLQMLEHTLEQQRTVADSVLEHNAVLIQPAKDPESAQLFFVRFGRYVYNMTMARSTSVADRKRLEEALRTFFDPNQLRPVRYNKPEVDEIRILLTWMYAHRTSTETVYWSADKSTADFSAEIVSQLRPIAKQQRFPISDQSASEGLSRRVPLAGREYPTETC